MLTSLIGNSFIFLLTDKESKYCCGNLLLGKIQRRELYAVDS